jgi:ferredoxin-NADP reductase
MKPAPHFGRGIEYKMNGNPQFPLTAPLIGIVTEKKKINTNPKMDVVDLVVDVKNQGLEIKEGQSVGIIPPGIKNTWMRFYSVASIARNMHDNVEKLTLCVKRYIWYDKQGNETKRGLASSYLSNLRPGETLPLYGPFGLQLQPTHPPDANLLILASGTGIASFRTMLEKRYAKGSGESGKTHLLFATPNPQDGYYHNDFEKLKKFDGFTFTPVHSRSDAKQHLDDVILQNGKAFIEQLKDPKTHVYLCGPNAIENMVVPAFRKAAEQAGENWETLYKRLQQENRWKVETKPSFYTEMLHEGQRQYAPKVPLNGYTPFIEDKATPKAKL